MIETTHLYRVLGLISYHLLMNLCRENTGVSFAFYTNDVQVLNLCRATNMITASAERVLVFMTTPFIIIFWFGNWCTRMRSRNSMPVVHRRITHTVRVLLAFVWFDWYLNWSYLPMALVSYNFSSASKTNLGDMGKCILWMEPTNKLQYNQKTRPNHIQILKDAL